LGPVTPGGILSANHWTIYLLVGNGQLNMKMNLSPNKTRGIYEVTEQAYKCSNTAVQFFNFPTKESVTVG
ncbi:uncharacterized protein BDZ99DRAFT_400836, partial [Mytilinidion resinicola]